MEEFTRWVFINRHYISYTEYDGKVIYERT